MLNKELLIGVATAAVIGIGAGGLKTWKDFGLLENKLETLERRVPDPSTYALKSEIEKANEKLVALERKLLLRIENNELNISQLNGTASKLDDTRSTVAEIKKRESLFENQVNDKERSVNGNASRISSLEGLNMQPLTLYQCPDNEETNGSAPWASFGCIGQISNQKTCGNFAWNAGEKSFACDPIIVYRKM